MSKITRKCPNCGAIVQGDAKYCKKCHAKLDSGRVETLPQTEKAERSARKMPWKKRADDDALRNLPRPVRPTEDSQPEPDMQAQEGEGFFTPAYAGENTGRGRTNRVNMAPDGSPRPVSTARGVDDRKGSGKLKDKNLWQIIAVLAAILVIIIIAIVLVVRLNRPADEATQPSEPFNSANIVNVSNGNGGDGTAAPPEQSGTPVVTAPPTNTPSPTPQATPTPVPTPSATPTPTPSATPAGNSNYPVTGTNDTVYISGNGVNIRSGPGTDNSILGTENAGYQLQRTGTTSNGWSRVYYKGSEAYVSNSLITTTAPSSGTTSGTTTGTTSGTTGSTGTTTSQNVTSASGTVTVNGSGVNIRSGPGTTYSSIGSASSGTKLTRTGTTSNGWTQISYNGQTAYIATQYVTVDSSTSSGTTSGTTSSGTTSSVTAESGTVTVTGNSVNIRSGPGTNYGIIGSANSGNTLTVTGKSGNWYQVSYSGQTGYISADYATKN